MLVLENVSLSRPPFEMRADWSLEAGARVGVIGPSGAGKSTLLGAVGGYEALSSGRIVLDGQNITTAPPGKRDVAMLFQDGNLFPGLTVAQNVGLALKTNLRLTRDDEARIAKALEQVGLTGFENRRPAEISGGQQSRAALARVLLQSRAWLLLDEPFSALGPAMRLEMLELVGDVLDATGAGLLMVTHDPKDAMRIADKTIFVDQGLAHAPQSTDQLFANPPLALKAYLG